VAEAPAELPFGDQDRARHAQRARHAVQYRPPQGSDDQGPRFVPRSLKTARDACRHRRG
jgi:hypothetical protein